jgi:hypothetical protein
MGFAATNLTANKARFLPMACLLKFGSLPAAKAPYNKRRARLHPQGRRRLLRFSIRTDRSRREGLATASRSKLTLFLKWVFVKSSGRFSD